MLRLHFPTGDLIIDHRAALAPVRRLHCLDSEDEVRRLLLLALTTSTALDRLRCFWAHWHSESYRVNVINDRKLIDRVARMTVNGPLAAFAVFPKPALNTSHVAAKLVSGAPAKKTPPVTGPPPAHVTNPSTAAPKHLALNPRGEAIGAPPPAASRLAATSPISSTIAPPTYDVQILSIERRFEQVLRRTPPYLPQAMRADFMKLLEPEMLVTTVGVLAVWAGSHAIGIGFIIDALLVIAGIVFLGMAIIDVANLLRKALELTVEAKEEKDLEEAAKLVAEVVAKIGVAAFVALITHAASRTTSAAMKGKGEGLRRIPEPSRVTRREYLNKKFGRTGNLNEDINSRSPVDGMYLAAPAAKAEIDAVADEIAKTVGGRVARAKLKSKARAIEKAIKEYNGHGSRVSDIARNTIIVPKDKIPEVVAALKQKGAKIKITNVGDDEFGYTGVNSKIRTEAGIQAEIQVNTPEMIFAKEKPEIARQLLGDELYDSIADVSPVPGGKGHEFYEKARALPPDAPERESLAEESRAYYKHFQ